MNFKKLLFLVFLLPSILFAQVDSTDIMVQNMMRQQKIVGLSLAVVKNGKTMVNKGYGFANAEHKVPATSETVFRLASISKQFFATAIMKLQEDGKLTTEDYVHKYFPDAPETWKSIQIKHLLSHTSGLKREAPAYDNNKIQPDLAVIKSAYSEISSRERINDVSRPIVHPTIGTAPGSHHLRVHPISKRAIVDRLLSTQRHMARQRTRCVQRRQQTAHQLSWLLYVEGQGITRTSYPLRRPGQ